MIVILCNSFYEAIDSFDIFMEFLNENTPWSIKRVFESSYCVETDDDLKYVFVDYRFESLFDKADCIDVDQFFEGIGEYYSCGYYNN